MSPKKIIAYFCSLFKIDCGKSKPIFVCGLSIKTGIGNRETEVVLYVRLTGQYFFFINIISV